MTFRSVGWGGGREANFRAKDSGFLFGRARRLGTDALENDCIRADEATPSTQFRKHPGGRRLRQAQDVGELTCYSSSNIYSSLTSYGFVSALSQTSKDAHLESYFDTPHFEI